MSKDTNKRAYKRLERAKVEYINALRAFEAEEEIRIALERQPMVSLRNVQIYSAYYTGARKAFELMADEDSFLYQNYGRGKSEDKVYRKAIFNLIINDIRKVEIFMNGADIGFCNHKRDKRGKLTSCEAYFFEDRVIRKRIDE